ncbi:hypothetical protein [Sulfolobus super-elliptical virus]|nr:hypothetical protein [Sulfolobus super-elliptical virus]
MNEKIEFQINNIKGHLSLLEIYVMYDEKENAQKELMKLRSLLNELNSLIEHEQR